MKTKQPKLMIGWRETVGLPKLGLDQFHAKIDTGARTTALHATGISKMEVNGEPWVEFVPDHDVLKGSEICVVPILHMRGITNSSGQTEERYIIATELRIGDREARVEVSLTDRSDMQFPLIIGRTALRQMRLTVDPSSSWLLSPKFSQINQKEEQ